jgi:hypothetical protein
MPKLHGKIVEKLAAAMVEKRRAEEEQWEREKTKQQENLISVQKN